MRKREKPARASALSKLGKAVRQRDWKQAIDNGQEQLHGLAKNPSEQLDPLATSPADAARWRTKLAAWEREVTARRLRDFQSEGR